MNKGLGFTIMVGPRSRSVEDTKALKKPDFNHNFLRINPRKNIKINFESFYSATDSSTATLLRLHYDQFIDPSECLPHLSIKFFTKR